MRVASPLYYDLHRMVESLPPFLSALRWLLVAIGLLTLCSCTSIVEFPPPEQQARLNGSTPAMRELLVPMNDKADRDIVSDIIVNDPGMIWRWTRSHPRVRVWPDVADGWQIHARLTIAGTVIEKTRRQAVTLRVNDRSLDSRTFEKEGTVEFDSPVPAGVIRTGAPTIMGLDIDPVMTKSEGREEFGVLLHEIGLRWVGVK